MKSLNNSPLKLGNGHLETIIPFIVRRPPKIKYIRERITTPDKDFLDLDWSRVGSDFLVVLNHGFESNSKAQYILGMVKNFNDNGFDCLAWNYRSCSGEMNRTGRFYHSGATDDLEFILKHALNKKPYKAIYLIGFSLGGNLILKYLGERSGRKGLPIQGACAFSVPCCLKSSSTHLSKGFNKVYSEVFMQSMRRKVLAKKDLVIASGVKFPDLKTLKTLEDFDNHFTAPLHGMRDAEDYYKQNSAKYFLKKIKIPTLLVNSKNDPFLTPECTPWEKHQKHPYLQIELVEHGGHVGFLSKGFRNVLWSESRALEFIQSLNT